MNQELLQYKNFRIAELKNNYNNNCIFVTQYYNNIINIVLKSRAFNKTKQVNSIKSFLASSISNLTNKYNSDMLKKAKNEKFNIIITNTLKELEKIKTIQINDTKTNILNNSNLNHLYLLLLFL